MRYPRLDGARFDSAPRAFAGTDPARPMADSHTDRERGEKRALVSTDDVDDEDATADADGDAED